MKKNYLSHFLLVLSVCLLITQQVFARTEGELAAGMVNPGHTEKPAWFKVSFLDLFEDVEEATAKGKRLMIYYYQDGCPYCKKLLEDNFGQRDIADRTQEYFDVVAINLWGDQDIVVGDKTYTEKNFAEALKVQYTPTLLFFNENKKIIFRANGYYPPEKFSALLDYIGKKQESKISYQDFMAEASTQPSTGKLHDDINTLPSASVLTMRDKPLLVMFEQKKCNTCDELHLDILKRKESMDLLSGFDVVVLDMWSDEKVITPSGERTKIRSWAKKRGVKYAPSLLFFDKKGEEVFRTDAYLKAFHTQTAMDYVLSGAYKKQSNFQRFVEARADRLRGQGIEVNLME
ncbi:MAG TPA: thioredoxin [Gammaproteobacteria bacterium]|nr:thioredoxin [Gammaproteobacteria bacterium]